MECVIEHINRIKARHDHFNQSREGFGKVENPLVRKDPKKLKIEGAHPSIIRMSLQPTVCQPQKE